MSNKLRKCYVPQYLHCKVRNTRVMTQKFV